MAPLDADINSDCYYGVLGLQRNATDAEITKAYRKLALKHHPDKNPDDKDASERFRKLSEAYDILHDSEKRKTYDQFGKAAFEQGAAPEGAPGRAGYPGGGVSFQSSGMSSAQAEEMFRTIFSGQGGMFGGMGSGMRMPGGGAQTFNFQPGGMEGSEHGMSFPFDISGSGGFGGLSGGGGARASRRPPSYAIPESTRVIVQGLAKAPEHNGKIGRVASWKEATGRYQVEVEGAAVLSLRPQHLVQLCRVEVGGLETKPELNGRHADIYAFDEERCRYLVLVEGPTMALSLQPSHCILPEGTRVILSGLSNAVFNGQMARITSVHRDSRRYKVQCQNGRHISIKYENVRC